MQISHCTTLSKFKFLPENYKILIIDDSKSTNKILTNMFTEKGFVCLNAFSLKEARDILKDVTVDYVMLDINLPDGNGYELIIELQHTPEKIFVLTTENDKQFMEISYQKGVIDFLVKDKNFFYKIKQIIASVEKLEINKFKTILIVDDSFVIREQLKDLLQNRHYNIETAADGDEALVITRNKRVDLILLDIELKSSNGLEFLQKNSTELINQKNIPVLIISGNIDSTTFRSALRVGAVDVLKKPYVTEEIVLKVDLWIDTKQKDDDIACSMQLLEQYKSTVDRSAIVSKTNDKGIITYVNEQFCKISGYTEDELIGQSHQLIRHSDMSSEMFKEMWHTIKELKKPWTGEVKNKKKTGEAYWVQSIINPIINLEGEIVEYIGIRTDITEQVNIKQYFEGQLQTTVQDLSHTMKLATEYEMAINESNILSRSDLKGKITYVNDKFCEITGYKKEEAIGKNHSIVRHKDTPKEIITNLWDTIKAGKVWNGILKNKNKSGKPYWVDSTIVPISNTDGDIIEYMAIRHDLTELFELHAEIEDTQKEIIYTMGEIGETRSKETGNHVKRVAEYSKLLAVLCGIDEKEAELLKQASPMHDIGKVGIPDSILKKAGKLDDEEWKVMKSHAQLGSDMVAHSTRPILKAAAIVASEHHERWDGTGYPKGLAGEKIHLYGRITALADVFDALGSERCYKKAWDDEKIFALFKEEKGKQFDPKLVDLFFDNLDKFLEIRDNYKDTEELFAV